MTRNIARFALLLTGAVAITAGVEHLGSAWVAACVTPMLERMAAAEGATLRRAKVDASLLGGRITVGDLVVERHGLELSVGHASFPIAGLPGFGTGGLITHAWAQTPLTMQELTFSAGDQRIRIPSLAVTPVRGGSVDPSLFATQRSPVGEAFRTFDAERITIPTIELTRRRPLTDDVLSFGTIEGGPVRAGRIARVTIAQQRQLVTPRGDVDTDRKEEAERLRLDSTSEGLVLEGVDLPVLFAFLFDTAATAIAPRPAIERYRTASTTVVADKDMRLTVGPTSLEGIALGVMTRPLHEVLPALEEQLLADDITDDRMREALRKAAGLFGAVGLKALDMTEMAITVTVPGDGPIRLTLGRLALAWNEAGSATLTMGPLRIGTDGGSLSLESLAWTHFRFPRPLAEALDQLSRADDLLTPDLRAFVPLLDNVALTGMALDLPEAGNPSKSTRFEIGRLAFAMANHRDSIPTRVDGVLEDIAGHNLQEAMPELAELGLQSLRLSGRLAYAWDEPARAVEVEEVSLRSPDFGSVRASMRFGGVTADVFSSDTAVATVALLGATAERAEITVENTGGVERFYRVVAQQRQMSEEAVRQETALGAGILLAGLLASHPDAREIGEAVTRFLAQPRRLTIRAEAQPPGLGLADLMAQQSTALLGRLRLRAQTQP